jgi:LysM repeat protein
MNFRRLVFYLLLNAVVSATATYAVLWYWDRTHPAGPAPVVVAGATAPVGTNIPAGADTPIAPTQAAPTLTLPPAGETAAAGPTPTLYVVQAGDTLGSIAQRFEVTVAAIMDANGLSDANVIAVGQTLLIPVEGYVPPTATASNPGPLPTNAAEPPRPTATRDPNLPLPRLEIREVRGAGVLADEALIVVNEGGPVDLLGWSLRDETGHLYVFPSLMLFQDGAVSVHTAAGTDSVTDLYWGQAQAVWASGRSVLLSDDGGNLHTRYTVP